MTKSAKVLEPQEGIRLEHRPPNECCTKWTDAYIMPFWSHTNLISDSTDGMEIPKYCPGCRRKLHHTREFDVGKEVKHIPRGIKHPYPIRKEPKE